MLRQWLLECSQAHSWLLHLPCLSPSLIVTQVQVIFLSVPSRVEGRREEEGGTVFLSHLCWGAHLPLLLLLYANQDLLNVWGLL